MPCSNKDRKHGKVGWGDCRYCNCTAAKISRSVTAQIQLLCNLSTILCKASSVHSGFSASQCC